MIEINRTVPGLALRAEAVRQPYLPDLGREVFDRAIALMALILLLPLFLLVGAAIKIDSPGPVFFRQTRGGKGGVPFEIYKFRSMRRDASDRQARRADPRVTRIGVFLRRSSIDELPQLINVLKGDMSLVGPRPHAVCHDRYYAPRVALYMKRYEVKPGLTGWAQVNNARGETETLAEMAKRTALDLEYIRQRSFRLDLSILVRTPRALVTTRQAY